MLEGIHSMGKWGGPVNLVRKVARDNFFAVVWTKKY